MHSSFSTSTISLSSVLVVESLWDPRGGNIGLLVILFLFYTVICAHFCDGSFSLLFFLFVCLYLFYMDVSSLACLPLLFGGDKVGISSKNSELRHVLLVNLAFDDWAISPAHYRRGLKWRRKQLGNLQTLSIKLKIKRLNKLLSWQAKTSKIINIKVLNIHTVKRGDLERKEKEKSS